MPSLERLRPLTRLPRTCRFSTNVLYRSYATGGPYSDKVVTNDPAPPNPVQNVSDSNAVPVSAMGLRDAPMQEMPEDGERQRQMQAPNRAEIWSRSQQSREMAMSGPRFEQTMMQFQVRNILLEGGKLLDEKAAKKQLTRVEIESCKGLIDRTMKMVLRVSLYLLQLTRVLCIATTRSCHKLDPQTASPMDEKQDCVV